MMRDNNPGLLMPLALRRAGGRCVAGGVVSACSPRLGSSFLTVVSGEPGHELVLQMETMGVEASEAMRTDLPSAAMGMETDDLP